MKESKALRILSYILLSILIATMILSVYYVEIKDSNYYNETKYFQSEYFVSTYMSRLSYGVSSLIYNNPEYKNITDDDNYIYYTTEGEFDYEDPKMYFLIIYKNKAFTNVELTSEVNSIESIKNYIENIEGNKTFDIIGGEIITESKILQKKAEQYLDNFVYTYYTIELSEAYDEYGIARNSIEYITASIEDFEIYTSYTEKFGDSAQQAIANKFIEMLEPYNEILYTAIPISVILSILIIIYLIVSVGHRSGTDGIVTNDFDKIPLEIILFIAFLASGIVLSVVAGKETNELELVGSLFVTAYMTIYIVFAISFDTIVKRIKSKTFWKTTIIGKIVYGIGKIFNKFKEYIDNIRSSSKYFKTMSRRFLIYAIILIILSIINFVAFSQINQALMFVLEIILIILSIYLIMTDFSSYDKTTIEVIEKAIQDRLKSERLKTELITNVSHDIKTPLTSIINYVDLLKQENIEDEKAKEYIEILDSKSQRLKKLIEDLVEVSKVSTGNVKLNLEKLNIVELINQAVGEFEDKFKNRELDIIIDSKETEINIMADSRYMYRIVENLFCNISKYALENSRVYIDIMKVENHVCVAMKNISKEKLNISADELMQRFVRGDKSRTTEGSGLGISIAKSLTEVQKGEFNLKLDGDLFKVELIFNII